MTIGSATWNGLESAISLLSGKGQWQSLAVGDAPGITLLSGKLLAGGIGHSPGFNQFLYFTVEAEPQVPAQAVASA